MATITPVRSSIHAGIEAITWTGLSTADTATSVLVTGSTARDGSMMVAGTLGGATIALQGSNDGTNFFTMSDVSFTATGIEDFTMSAAYIRPVSSGGTGDDVTVTIVLRG